MTCDAFGRPQKHTRSRGTRYLHLGWAEASQSGLCKPQDEPQGEQDDVGGAGPGNHPQQGTATIDGTG
eukprot:1184969-Prorocentrum_minimum.AAC.2